MRKHITLLVLLYILSFSPRKSFAEDQVSVKWEDYAEDNGRINVIAKYIGIQKKVTERLSVKALAVNDVITGATPIGSPESDGSIPLSEIEDERNAAVVDLIWEDGNQVSSFQYARSKESDFISDGYAFTGSRYFNKKNVRLSLGIAYTDDAISGGPLTETEFKDSWDGFIGVNFVTTPNDTVSINLTHGKSDGYLNDPYKSIVKNAEILPGLILPLAFSENRPSTREKDIFLINGKHYFESLHASLDAEYRYYTDDWDVHSNTFKLEWYQKIGERLILIPKLRYYSQSQASFYRLDLDALDFDPSSPPDPDLYKYSADYRLAKMQTLSAGLKLIYKWGEHLSLDLEYERYEMEGKDDFTPADAFPDASISTVGLTWYF